MLLDFWNFSNVLKGWINLHFTYSSHRVWGGWVWGSCRWFTMLKIGIIKKWILNHCYFRKIHRQYLVIRSHFLHLLSFSSVALLNFSHDYIWQPIKVIAVMAGKEAWLNCMDKQEKMIHEWLIKILFINQCLDIQYFSFREKEKM